MKVKVYLMVLLVGLFFAQCEKAEELDKSYVKINGEEYSLTKGYIDDEGTDQAISYRSYDLQFQNAETDNPKTFFYFEIKSTSTERLEEGVYNYNSWFEKGEFSTPVLKYNLEYDDGGQIVSGTAITESIADDISGTVTISKDNGNYVFDIDLVFTVDGQTKNVEIHFNNSLAESYLSYYK